MIVLDASALVDLLLRTERAEWVEAWFPLATQQFAAPDLIGYELLSALRRNVAAGACAPSAADSVLEAFRRLPKRLYPVEAAMLSAWTLRETVSMADALYVTIAGALGVPLVTTDARLARAVGVGAAAIPVACPGFATSVVCRDARLRRSFPADEAFQ